MLVFKKITSWCFLSFSSVTSDCTGISNTKSLAYSIISSSQSCSYLSVSISEASSHATVIMKKMTIVTSSEPEWQYKLDQKLWTLHGISHPHEVYRIFNFNYITPMATIVTHFYTMCNSYPKASVFHNAQHLISALVPYTWTE